MRFSRWLVTFCLCTLLCVVTKTQASYALEVPTYELPFNTIDNLEPTESDPQDFIDTLRLRSTSLSVLHDNKSGDFADIKRTSSCQLIRAPPAP